MLSTGMRKERDALCVHENRQLCFLLPHIPSQTVMPSAPTQPALKGYGSIKCTLKTGTHRPPRSQPRIYGLHLAQRAQRAVFWLPHIAQQGGDLVKQRVLCQVAALCMMRLLCIAVEESPGKSSPFTT
jgi:hypothetical protein